MSDPDLDEIIEATTREVVEDEMEEKEVKMVECTRCGEKVPFHQFNLHLKEKHPADYLEIKQKRARAIAEARRRKREAELEAEAPPTGPQVAAPARKELTPDEIRTIVALEGREGLNRLKRERLQEVLSKHPRVTPRVKEYVLYVWDTNELVRNDPNYLFFTLRDAGLEIAVAKQITEAVWSLEWSYANILQQYGYTPVFPNWMQSSPGPVPYYASYPQPASQLSPLYQPTPQLQSPMGPPFSPTPLAPAQHQYMVPPPMMRPYPEEYEERPRRRRMMEEEEEKKYATIEDVQNLLRNFFAELKEEAEREEKEKKITTLETQLKLMEQKLEVMTQQPKKSEEAEALLQQLEALRAELKEIKEAERRRERQMLEAQIAALRTELQELRRAQSVSSYSSDTYRLLSQIAERRPIETITRVLFPEVRGAPPPVIPQQTYLPREIEEELKRAGLTE